MVFDDRVDLHLGDSLEVLRGLPTNSVDALVTDPPAGISFMNLAFDGDKGGRRQWIAWLTEIMRECYRVMKPGAHGLVWALPRTSHWTATALEDAGFEIRDRVAAVFATGFPKSANVSYAIDDKLGAERRYVEARPQAGAKFKQAAETIDNGGFNDPDRQEYQVREPVTEEAKRWAGWHSSLKPAVEDWWLIRKPLIGTIAENVLTHGTGALNIDDCRIGTRNQQKVWRGSDRGRGVYGDFAHDQAEKPTVFSYDKGRWPTNLMLGHSAACEPLGVSRVSNSGSGSGGIWSPSTDKPAGPQHGDGTGFETVQDWSCVLGCPVKLLDERAKYGIIQPWSHSAVNVVGSSSPERMMWPGGSEDIAQERAVDRQSANVDTPTQDGLSVATGDGIVSGASQEKESSGASWSIDGSGSKPMGPSQMGSKSITLTTPLLTTGSKTSKLLPLNGTTTIISDVAKTTESGQAEPLSADANDATNTDQHWTSPAGLPEHTRDIASRVLRPTSASGAETIGPAVKSTAGDTRRKPEAGASRFFAQFHPFFYAPKPSRAERDRGCEDLVSKSGGELTGRKDGSPGLNSPRAGAGRTSGGRNQHPTVKALSLMEYLCRLITPPGGQILDPFLGSGTTGCAALREGFRFVGIEISPEYLEIARARIQDALGPDPQELPLFADLPAPTQGSLFDQEET